MEKQQNLAGPRVSFVYSIYLSSVPSFRARSIIARNGRKINFDKRGEARSSPALKRSRGDSRQRCGSYRDSTEPRYTPLINDSNLIYHYGQVVETGNRLPT